MRVVATYSSYTWGHAFFSPSLDFSGNGYNATAKSVDGVNIKNTFCSHTVILIWETWDCAACADGNEAGSGDVLLPCSPLGVGSACRPLP